MVGAGAVTLPRGVGLVCSPLGFFSMEAGKAAVQVLQCSRGMGEPGERLFCVLLSHVKRGKYPVFRWWF